MYAYARVPFARCESGQARAPRVAHPSITHNKARAIHFCIHVLNIYIHLYAYVCTFKSFGFVVLVACGFSRIRIYNMYDVLCTVNELNVTIIVGYYDGRGRNVWLGKKNLGFYRMWFIVRCLDSNANWCCVLIYVREF